MPAAASPLSATFPNPRRVNLVLIVMFLSSQATSGVYRSEHRPPRRLIIQTLYDSLSLSK
jgi:hypothetical protein